MERFEDPTFVVLDVPSPVADAVLALRGRNSYHLSEPVTITIAGSSGVGVFDGSQRPSEAFAVLDEIAERQAPIHGEFAEVLRFPGSNIFVLTLKDEAPFRALHRAVADSGLSFVETPFPYRPHCTFRFVAPEDDDHAAALLAVEVPGEFRLDTLSVYGWRRLSNGEVECPLRHRTRARFCGDSHEMK